MLLEIHRLDGLAHDINPQDHGVRRVGGFLHEWLSRPNAFDMIQPGTVNAEKAAPYTVEHMAAAITFFLQIEPHPRLEYPLLRLL